MPEYTFIEGLGPDNAISEAIMYYSDDNIDVDKNEIELSDEFLDRWDELKAIENEFWQLRYDMRQYILGTANLAKDFDYHATLAEFEEAEAEYYRGLYKLIRDYENEYAFMKLSGTDQRNLEWILKSYEVSEKTGANVISMDGLRYNANVIQRFLFQSNFTLGLPFIVCFLLIFISIYSGEKETGSLEFLRMQPAKRRSIVISKLVAMMLSGLFYFLILILSMCLIAVFQGIPLDGLKDLYRVFPKDQSVAALTGAQLLGLVFVAFLLILLFFSTLLLMISTRTGKVSLAMATLFILLGLSYAMLEVIPQFRSAYHPLQQLDYLRVLIGKLVKELTGDGSYTDVSLPAEGLKPYLMLFVPSIIFLVVSLHPVIEQRPKKELQRPASSFLGLEMKKTRKAQSYTFYLVGGILILSVFFVFPLTNDAVRIKSELLDEFEIKRTEEFIKYYEVHYEERKKGEVDGGGEAVGIDYETQLEMFEESLADLRSELNARLAKREALTTGDSQTYYENILKLFNTSLTSYEGSGIIGGQPTRFSLDESTAILKQLEENQDPLVPLGGWHEQLQYSARENYASSLDRQMYRGMVQPSHSAVFWPYRLLSRHYMDIILLVAIAVITFAGYTLDKENGNQLEFLMTQPLAKARIHLTKLASGMLMGTVFIVILLVFAALCGLLAEGFGAYQFPIVLYSGNDFSLIPLWQYLLRVLGAILVQAFFLNALMLLISVVTRNRVQLLGFTSLIMIIGLVITELLPSGWARTLSPFNYFQASTLANQAVRYYNDIPQASYLLGLGVLAVFAVIFTLIGIFLISRREIKPVN